MISVSEKRLISCRDRYRQWVKLAWEYIKSAAPNGDAVEELAVLMEELEYKHVGKQQWKRMRDSEREDAIHPCTDWQAGICDCKGSCSCHWDQDW